MHGRDPRGNGMGSPGGDLNFHPHPPPPPPPQVLFFGEFTHYDQAPTDGGEVDEVRRSCGGRGWAVA